MNTPGLPYTILYLNDYLHGMGGAERNMLQLLGGVDRSIFAPVVCCLSGGDLVDDIRSRGVEIRDLKVKRIYGLSGLRALGWLLGYIKRKRVSLIVSYHESSDFLGLAAAKLSGVPIVSSRRDVGYKLARRHKRAYRLLNRHYSAIIAVSEAVKDSLLQEQGGGRARIVVIPNGVDMREFSRPQDTGKIRKELGISEGEKVVGVVASLRAIKGHQYFVEAAAQVSREFPNSRFLIVGKDYGEPGCSEGDLRQLAERLGMKSSQLVFTGQRGDISRLLAVMDVVVNPSLSEGMSNTVLEAMAAGRVVIASDVGGNPEVIHNGVTGYLLPAGDSTALAQKIRVCLNNKEMAGKLGSNARKSAQQHFSLARMCEANMSVYLRCIKGPEASAGAVRAQELI